MSIHAFPNESSTTPGQRLQDVAGAARRLVAGAAHRFAAGLRPRGAPVAMAGGRNEGPPDLDELWRDFNRKLSGLLGGGKGGRGGPPQRDPGDDGNGFQPDMKSAGIGIGLIGFVVLVVWAGSGYMIEHDRIQVAPGAADIGVAVGLTPLGGPIVSAVCRSVARCSDSLSKPRVLSSSDCRAACSFLVTQPAVMLISPSARRVVRARDERRVGRIMAASMHEPRARESPRRACPRAGFAELVCPLTEPAAGTLRRADRGPGDRCCNAGS